MSYMASQKRNKTQAKHIENLALAFELAKINHGDRVFPTDFPNHKVPFIFAWFSPLYSIPLD